MRSCVASTKSLRGEDGPRFGQPLRPGPAYYWIGAALALALIFPAPFFWAPPLWVVALMARKPVGDRRRKPAAAVRPVGQVRPFRPLSPPANDNPTIPPTAASPRKGEILGA